MKPMLAQTGSEPWLDEIEHDRDWAVTRKWDGVRLIWVIANSGNKLITRLGHNVIDKFPSFHKRIPELDGTILDTEGVTSSNYLGDVQSIVHQHAQSTNLILVLLDVLRYKHTNMCSLIGKERKVYLKKAHGVLRVRRLPVMLEKLVFKDKRKYYKDLVKSGAEGVVAKDLLGEYEEGKRSYTWMKVKPRNTYDFVILGFTEGTGKYKKWIGAVKYGAMYQGKMVEVGTSSGMTDAERKDMTDSPRKYIGKVAEFEAQETTRNGVMRHPSYVGLRHDLSPRSIQLETYLHG